MVMQRTSSFSGAKIKETMFSNDSTPFDKDDSLPQHHALSECNSSNRKRSLPLLFVVLFLGALCLMAKQSAETHGSAQRIISTQSELDVATSYSHSSDESTAATTRTLTTTAQEEEEESQSQQPLVTALLVELRCHKALALVLKQADAYLEPDSPFVVLHSRRNKKYMERLVNETLPHRSVSFKEIRPKDYGSTNYEKYGYRGQYWYSKLFTDLAFLQENIHTPYVLTLQSDTLLCRALDPQEFVADGQSFVGGLSGFKRVYQQKVDVPPNPSSRGDKDMKYKHLNGGVSLRNVEWSKRCLERYFHNDEETSPKAKKHALSLAEDSFFRHCKEQRLVEGTVPTTEREAYAFASDNGVTLCFDDPVTNERVCPFATHKPWKTYQKRWGAHQYQELVESCPGLGLHRELCDGQSDFDGSPTCLASFLDDDGVTVTKEFQCDCDA